MFYKLLLEQQIKSNIFHIRYYFSQLLSIFKEFAGSHPGFYPETCPHVFWTPYSNFGHPKIYARPSGRSVLSIEEGHLGKERINQIKSNTRIYNRNDRNWTPYYYTEWVKVPFWTILVKSLLTSLKQMLLHDPPLITKMIIPNY